MKLDEGHYRGLFLREGRDVHDDVVDYLMPFLKRRKEVYRGMTVDQIRQHCEHIIQKPVPMDIFIGALLYDRYHVEEIEGQFYASISQRSPLIAIQNGRGKNSMWAPFIRQWYGNEALEPWQPDQEKE